MTTAVVDPLARRERASGGAPARRAIVRWSARLFRREWRQQTLLLALVTVAVAATTGGLALATNAGPTASTTVSLPGNDPRLNDDLAAITAAFGSGQVIHHRRLTIAGSIATVDLRAHDTGAADPTTRLIGGRLPATIGEVAMTHRLAATLGLHVGATWATGDRTFRVVGLVENPQDLHDTFALTASGGADPATNVAVIIHGAPGQLPRVHLPSGAPLQIEGVSAVSKAASTLAVLALATMGLLFVGLVAVAGFTVVAQRHLRALGMLTSLGATRRQVRLVMVANGAAVGLAGALAGALAGLGGWLALAPAMESVVGHRIDRFAIPWWGVGAAVGLAIVTAVAAAWWPARSLSRMSVMAALSGRPPRPQPARRFATVGCVLLAAGLVMLVGANQIPGSASHRGRILLVLGIVTATVGLLPLAPLGIGALASRVGGAPVAVRLALRDLSRYRARSGAALGAVTLAVVIAATISVTSAYQSATNGPTVANLPANQLVVYRSNPREPLPDINAEELHTAEQGIATIASGLGAQKALELDTARDPAGELLQGAAVPGRERAALLAMTAEPGGGSRIEMLLPLYLATPAILDHDGISPSQIDPAADVIIAKPLLALVQVTRRALGSHLVLGTGPRHTIDPKIQTLDMPAYAAAPVALLTAHGLETTGLQPIVAGWLIEARRPITAAQIRGATKTAAAVGLTVEAADRHNTSQLGTDASVAGIVLALGVLAMTVGLIRAESANELRTLTATGATAKTRRTLTAATAGSLAVLGVLLGLGGAYVEAVAWYHHRLGPLGHPPYANLLTIAVGLPVAAAVGGWALAGRQPPAIARRPLE
ncbi:MAG: hypothetical protein JWO37_1894 [Acidimicrobiales bacterium]|jgi:putative ABC transport system permease protein|nr:hypothetical protein [Acidimicrobiales bacterium]